MGFLIVATIGFADATFLTVEHYAKQNAPCFITSRCDVVLTSSYATIAGIPISLGGALFYLAMMIGSLLALDTKKEAWLKRVAGASVIGLATSIYLVSIQAFVLHAYCIYCVGSAATSTVLFLMACFVWRRFQHEL